MNYQLEMFPDVKGPPKFTVLTTVPPSPKPDDDFVDMGGEG